MSFQPLEEASPLVADEPESSDVTTWDVDAVCTWLEGLGLKVAVAGFRKQKVCGAQLLSIHEAHLIEMGVTLIGDRLTLLEEIAELRIMRRMQENRSVIWEATQSKSINGICDFLYKKHIRPIYRCITCFKKGWFDEYKLTTTCLIVQAKERAIVEETVCCGHAIEKTTRYIDLSSIVTATAVRPSPLSQPPTCIHPRRRTCCHSRPCCWILHPLTPSLLDRFSEHDAQDGVRLRSG